MAVKLGLTTGEQQRLENLRTQCWRNFAPKRHKTEEERRMLHNEHHNLYSSFSIKTTNFKRSSTWAHMREIQNYGCKAHEICKI